MTAHGFRATASSILHVDGNTVRRAYARAEFWDERVRMMQWWADRLDELKEAPRRPLPRGGPPHWANGTEITPNSPLISATPSFVRPSETGSEGSGNIRIFSPLHWHAIVWTDVRLAPTRENRFIPAPQYRRVRPPRVSDRAFLSKFQQCDEQGGLIIIIC